MLASSGIFPNSNLMLTLKIVYILASTYYICSYIIYNIDTRIDFKQDESRVLRLKIAEVSFRIIGYCFGTATNLIMLYIFFLYGKPYEDDTGTLIQNKLVEVFEMQEQ